MQKPDTQRATLRMESIWNDTEERIMQDIVRRIKKTGEITSTADYQINQLIRMGKSTEEVERMLKEALDATYPEMYELYDEVANWQYVRNRDIYEQINGEFIPPEDNEWLIQISEAAKKQTKETLENLSQSYGFTVMVGNKRVFTPFAQYYQKYVDTAIMDILSGGFDYNTVIKRVINQMTNSGLRSVDYASGHSNRTPVAVRRAIMTGISQITGKINERNAEILGTDYFEVSWHASARPSHRAWQGKVYSYKELVDICGLGSGDGLCGWNCYHEYYPFLPGISERLYTDEWLEAQNRKEDQKKEWMGKEYNAYEQTQKQRQMETSMRAQRQKVALLKEAGASKDEITLARAKYQAQLDEYARFCKKMGLKEQRERIYGDMRGRVAPSKVQHQKYLADKAIKNVAKDSGSGIINTEIDELTPCLRRMRDGKIVDTGVFKINPTKKDFTDWEFDWTKPKKKGYSVYELKAEGDYRTQGLIALKLDKDNLAVHIDIVEAAPFNNSHNKKFVKKEYNGVGGHLFAEAVKQSYDAGFDGAVYFTAKTDLIEHYEKELGAIIINPRERIMFIDEDAAKKLYNRYYGGNK